MENSSRFFQNSACKYYPCHAGFEADGFNCLFCFCPLYFLGDKCGGNFFYTDKNIKSCEKCALPHMPDYYDAIIAKLKDME